ncbi:hypothetical protein ACH436_14910 [Isoptericola sp. NPDC019693]|uniref:hypothetical protein n=1 Tax=Isoptericola sp. NPDC019693 TaxID=3364009 RepID=UPI00378FFA8A
MHPNTTAPRRLTSRPPRTAGRIVGAALATAALLAPVTAASAAPPAPAAHGAATAQALLASCPLGTAVANYDPGVTLLPADVQFDSRAEYTSCATSTDWKPFTVESSGTSERSCATLLGTITGVRQTITWRNALTGQITTSEATVDVTTTQVTSALLVTAQGTITSGHATGADYTQQVTYADLTALLSCLTPDGLTSLGNGITSLTISN